MTTVQGNKSGSVAEQATPAAGGVAASSATPTQVPTDAIKEVQARAEKDIAQLKSTFQKQLATQQKQFEAIISGLQTEIEGLKVSGMDETQRKEYEAAADMRKASQLNTDLQSQSARAQELEATLNAQTFFLQRGVPLDKLVMTEGYDALWTSGMDYITSELARLKSLPEQPPTNGETDSAKVDAPEVVLDNKGAGLTGLTWADLEKAYDTDQEGIYRLVETGQLPADIIPK